MKFIEMLRKIKSFVKLTPTYKLKNTVEDQFIKKIKCRFLFVSIEIFKPKNLNENFDWLVCQCIRIENNQLTKPNYEKPNNNTSRCS
ncbi:hypothetical protein B0A62_13385 [Flavobacterium hydatis]|uniref:Uncharacterized protein n=1 Tax=Flavobacterium hydatis TaxID=991 RepID=A0ABX4CFS3_FLAHY|nr:hypothetical protein B0A62_13385 [Flavobacterium hydatis]